MSSTPVIDLKPGHTKTHVERGHNKRIAGFSIYALLALNDALPTPGFGTKWGILSDGRKRVDWDKIYLDCILMRGGKQESLIQSMSLQDLACFSNYNSSTYESARYSDNGTFPLGDPSYMAQAFIIQFPTGAIVLNGKDELKITLRCEASFAIGSTATTATVAVGGSTITYVSSQSGIPFINKDNTRIQFSLIDASNEVVETSLPFYKSIAIEPGASSYPIPVGDNLVCARFIDYGFGRVNVDATTNENLNALASVSAQSEQLSYSAQLPQLWANSTRHFQNWNMLVPRRGDIEIYGDATAMVLTDFDAVNINLNLRPALVKDQKQKLITLQFSTTPEQQQRAFSIMQAIRQKKITQISN